MPSPYFVQAPAKLNLFLHITGRLANGYHQLQSLFTPITLCDTLGFTVREDGKVQRTTIVPWLDQEDDLIVKAARLLQAQYHVTQGVDLTIEKKIPSGAGLGGGSSDAATVLNTLNQLWGLHKPMQELLPLAVQLGADVPFFLQDRTALVEGIGEFIYPCQEPFSYYYLLIQPHLHIATVSIFKDPLLTRNTPKMPTHDLLKLLQEQARAKALPLYGYNDMQASACRLNPALGQLIDWVETLGLAIRMSGSGSSCFVAFASQEQAQQALDQLEKAKPLFLKQGGVMFDTQVLGTYIKNTVTVV